MEQVQPLITLFDAYGFYRWIRKNGWVENSDNRGTFFNKNEIITGRDHTFTELYQMFDGETKGK